MQPAPVDGDYRGMSVRYRRRLPKSTRNSRFSSANEAVSFFRADVQPMMQGDNKYKKQFLALEKKSVSTELRGVQRSKLEVLHKSPQMFFSIHFLADKRRRRQLDGEALTPPNLQEDYFTLGSDNAGTLAKSEDGQGPMTPELQLTSQEGELNDALQATEGRAVESPEKQGLFAASAEEKPKALILE